MRRFIATTLVLILTVFFTGCATYWYQEGKTLNECQKDRLECFEELKKYSPGWASMGAYEFEFMEECMKQRGYRLVTEKKLPLRVKRRDPDQLLHPRLHGVAGTLDE